MSVSRSSGDAAPSDWVKTYFPDSKPVGGGRWKARCPAHADQNPSLSITLRDDGRKLLQCFAGCSTREIVSAVGLMLADLYPSRDIRPSSPPTPKPLRSAAALANRTPRDDRHNGQRPPGAAGATAAVPKPPKKPDGDGKATVDAAIDAAARQFKRPADHRWNYHSESGELVGAVLRWNEPKGKEIRPVALIDGQWQITAMPKPRPLLGLPALLQHNSAAGPVLLVEGEKCCDSAESIGLFATTWPGGADNIQHADLTPLAGRDVVLLPDNDNAGRKAMETAAEMLQRLNPPATVRVVELPGLPEKSDLVDWRNAHGDTADPETLRAELLDLIDATEPEPLATANQEPGPVLTCLADVEPRAVDWLWSGRIPLGRITLLAGRPGEGKSFLTTDLAARVTTGTRWPDGSECPQGSVILMSAEDDPADTIRPRLDAHSADVRRVHSLTAVRKTDDKGEYDRLISLADVDVIAAALEQRPDCRLLVVDPIGSFVGSRTDTHRDNEVRAVLTPLAQLAERYGVAVLIVAHLRKASGSFADDSVLGSRAFTGVARVVWHVSRDPENRDRRLLLPGKNNLASEGDGLAFFITGEPAHIEWETDRVAMTADDALAAKAQTQRRKPGPESETLDLATEWLSAALAPGPRPIKELQDDWVNGHSGSKRTLERAKVRVNVEAYRPEIPGPWFWRLPAKAANQTAVGPNTEQRGDLGGLAETKAISCGFESAKPKAAKLFELVGVGPPNHEFAPTGDVAQQSRATAAPPDRDPVAAVNPVEQSRATSRQLVIELDRVADPDGWG